tara:strand:+ start:344 stop:1369 length:1026 start_codon:yes stop_codon:yes gene_type:complete
MKRKLLPIVIALSALAVSASAAFYSVFGLSKLFAGASTQVIIMASSLEFAKLVVASLLYQYWNSINKILRIYLSISVFVLMIITSGGIYGYLSGAYQETAHEAEYLDRQVAIIDQKKSRFEEQRVELKQSIKNWSEALTNPTTIQYVDKETGQLVTTTSSRQRKLLQSQLQEAKTNFNNVTDSITKLDVDILQQQIGNDTARELGPLKYLSNLLDVEMNKIINWFLLLIIFVFDPLAIAMVIAANFAFNQIKPDNKKEDYFTDRNKELERRVEGSLPEGAEWGVSYSLKDNDHFDSADVDELKHWTKVQRTSSMDITDDKDIYNEKQKKQQPPKRGSGYWY